MGNGVKCSGVEIYTLAVAVVVIRNFAKCHKMNLLVGGRYFQGKDSWQEENHCYRERVSLWEGFGMAASGTMQG